VSGLGHVEATGDTIVVGVANGGAAISSVAVALSEANVRVIELTMRTPTLDDVFLETTGARMRDEESETPR